MYLYLYTLSTVACPPLQVNKTQLIPVLTLSSLHSYQSYHLPVLPFLQVLQSSSWSFLIQLVSRFSASCYRSNRSEINFFSSFWVFCTCKTRPSCNRNRNSFLFPLQCDLIWILGQWVNVLWWASGLETLLLVPLFGAVLCTLPIHARGLENVGRGILKVPILLQLSCICRCICICIHIFIFFLYCRPRRRNCWLWHSWSTVPPPV